MNHMDGRKVSFYTLLLLGAGLISILWGLYSDTSAEVLRRAARICLECIGIG